ncbi:hypothetical protein CRM22_003293 [Opisthorchis felineus]|uniref:U3 small nucleolar RNA-associated protein 11 n=2 Tax=Opisthorchis felineus TaxID=147828 RepID=A0A4S2M210_OPIFE|nr:hypothetical protein CRM22_003293 [Opisthorchis felineus]
MQICHTTIIANATSVLFRLVVRSMPFASFKNAQKRYSRTHKERSQPQHRKHLGLLPKKKDFILKAREKEKKDKKIRELRRQALTKNTDEFYFNMCNSTFDTERGHIPLNAETKYSDATMKSLLSMSVAQLRHELQKEVSKIRRLESSTNALYGDPDLRSRHTRPKHTFFAETSSEAQDLRAKIKAGAFFSPDTNTTNVSILEERQEAYAELQQRLQRAETLKLMLKKREAKQLLVRNPNRKYKVVAKESKSSAPVYQFEPVRAR